MPFWGHGFVWLVFILVGRWVGGWLYVGVSVEEGGRVGLGGFNGVVWEGE